MLNLDPMGTTIVLVTAILAVAGLESMALWRGINGKMLTLAMLAIGALAGVSLTSLAGLLGPIIGP